MAKYHQNKIWDIDKVESTDEKTFLNRRKFIQLSALAGIGGMAGWTHALQSSDKISEADLLQKSISALPGSSFTACKRNKKFKVERDMTEEIVAAIYNNFYEFGTNKSICWKEAQKLNTRPWTVEVSGLVEKPKTFDIDDLIKLMPCEERVYRFRCVERWAMAVPWSGFKFESLMDVVRPLSSAKYVRFVSFMNPKEAFGQKSTSYYKWPYYEALTIEEASNELTFAATGLYGHDIPKQHGAPLRMVVPWKYGYKGGKSIVKIEFVDKQPKTFWNDLQANEYGFYSNVNPNKPHPRWSQKTETMIGTNKKFDTKIYNGYGEYVSKLYKGNEH